MSKEEKDFVEFMRDDAKTTFVVDEHTIEKYYLANNNKRFLKIRNGVLPLRKDFKELDDNELLTILIHTKMILLTKDIDEDEYDE